jgi:dTDP-4-amino-4,6-dideoxygalactose transaminase
MRKVVIAYPHVSAAAIENVNRVLRSRFIGQGPEVDRFEREFEDKFGIDRGCAVAVNSGTSALELAYDLLGLGPGDEVITSPLTCTATNIPLVRRGCKIVFADVSRVTLCLDPTDVDRKFSRDTKAIVNVHLNGVQSNLHWFPCPTVDDSAQALGVFRSMGFSGVRFTACSFQAIKALTTADGGMLVCADPRDAREAKLRRWFGIDREKKLSNNWQPFKRREILFDIDYPGYKFQMNDVAAALGRAHLMEYDDIMLHRRKLMEIYRDAGLPIVRGPVNMHGFACLLVENRDAFCAELERAGIEANVMQVRNDRYKIFAPFRVPLPNLDWIEDRYICIPLHSMMTIDDAQYVAEIASKALKLANVA